MGGRDELACGAGDPPGGGEPEGLWEGNRTWDGAKAQGVLSSVLRTCWQQERPAVGFVSQTLRAHGNLALPRLRLILPR